MKKLIALSVAFTFLAVNVSAAKFVLYYKNKEGSYWTKTNGTYPTLNHCENARKQSYSWAYETKCVSE